jgi:ABC-type branched-subunit amino acid transport system ATPase component
MTPSPPPTPALTADLALDPAVRLRLDPGQAHPLDGPRADEVVAALTGPSRGHRIVVAGHAVGRRGPAGRVRRGLVTVGRAPVADDVSVRDHLAAVVGGHRAAALLAGAPLLAGRGDDPAGVLSGGERRVLAWLRAAALDPTVVVLDRAGEGLDAASLAWAADTVASWRAAGVAVVVRPGRREERAWCEPLPSLRG